MAQPWQLPQLHTTDLPFFFFLTMLMMTAATMPISTAQMMIVQRFPAIHWSIYFTLTFFVSLLASLYGLKSINSMPAINRIEMIKPRMFRLPVNAPPIWLMHRAITYAKPHS